MEMTIKKLEQQIYVLEERLAKFNKDNNGKYPIEYYPLNRKVLNLKQELIDRKSKGEWNKYLSK